MARSNDPNRFDRRPEDWLPPARSAAGVSASECQDLIDASLAGISGITLPIAQSDVSGLPTALNNKLDDSQANTFGLTLLGAANVAAAKASLAYVKADIGLGSVDNTADVAKAVLSATKLATARNINGVPFDGTGNITINAVDATARVPTSRNVGTTAPLTGGGDLSADRTLAISAATGLAAGSMSAADKTKLDAITGSNTGDQTITLSGDVSGSGTGAISTVIGAGKVTLAMQANMATASLVYRKAAGAGAPEVQTLATLKTDLGLTGTNSGDQFTNTTSSRFLGRITAGFGAAEELTGTQATTLLDVATTSLKGLLAATDKVKVDAELSAVKYTATGAAQGPTIADYFTSTLSLEAASIYEIECHAYFLKTTAGTIIWTWAFSSAPVMATSRNQATPITGFTTAVITGAEVFSEATQEASTTLVHAVSGSLTTAVRHSFMFKVRVVTNLATTIQLRGTGSAGTITPQNGSYMRARKIV